MKVITEFLRENNEIDSLDDFDKEFLTHIAIDYRPHVGNKGLMILEKAGVYNGLDELADKIKDDIWKISRKQKVFNLTYYKEDFNSLPNIFFEQLIVRVNLTLNEGGEVNTPKELNDRLLFDKVDIYINIDFEEVRQYIMHEMTHAYQNYNKLLHGVSRFMKISQEDYNRIFTNKTDEYDDYIKSFLYFILRNERSAFIAQMSDELKTHKEEISSPLDAVKILKKCPIYYTYKWLLNKTDEYINGNINQENLQLIIDKYNQYFNRNDKPKQALKNMRSLIIKSIDKIENIIGKLVIENLDCAFFTAPSKLFLKFQK